MKIKIFNTIMDFRIEEKIEKEIKNLINNANKILILGIGEVTVGDDGFGPYITVHFLENKITYQNVLFMNGGSVPESREEEIIEFNPDLMLLIDVCESNDPPGTFIFAEEERLVNIIPISSHTLPLPILINKIKQKIPNLKTYLLGINPYEMKAQAERSFYKPEKYSFDDYEEDIDIPYYALNISDKMIEKADGLIDYLKKWLK